MMYVFVFLIGIMVGGALFGSTYERLWIDAEKDLDKCVKIVRNSQARIEVIDETSKK